MLEHGMTIFDEALQESTSTSVEERGAAFDTLEYVGFWPRAVARIVDTLAHFLISFVTGTALVLNATFMQGLTGAPAAPFIASLQKTSWIPFVFALLGSMAYHAATECIHGSSVGKRLLGITVRGEDGSGCTVLQGIKRSVAFLLDSLFFGAIAASAMSNSAQRQRNGDQWAKTVVVKTGSLPAHQRANGTVFVGALMGGFAVDSFLLATGYILQYALG